VSAFFLSRFVCYREKASNNSFTWHIQVLLTCKYNYSFIFGAIAVYCIQELASTKTLLCWTPSPLERFASSYNINSPLLIKNLN